MMWYGGHGSGWCSVVVNSPAMVLLWVAVVAAIVLAVRSAVRQPSDPTTPTGSGYPRRDGVVAARVASDETNSDDFYRRLM